MDKYMYERKNERTQAVIGTWGGEFKAGPTPTSRVVHAILRDFLVTNLNEETDSCFGRIFTTSPIHVSPKRFFQADKQKSAAPFIHAVLCHILSFCGRIQQHWFYHRSGSCCCR